MSDTFNYIIDSFSAAFMRFFELPVFVLIIGFLIIMVLVKWCYAKIRKKPFKIQFPFLITVLLGITLLVVDKKINRLITELNQTNTKVQQAVLNKKSVMTNYGDLLVDEKPIQQILDSTIVDTRKLNKATQLILLSKNKPPLAKAYITIIDLTYPTLKIHLSTNITKKTLTSLFAKQNNCDVAINGEAGESMSMDAPLGQWTGNYISKGNPILLQDSPERPFLSFNENNQATYFPEKIVDTTLTPQKYNTIWGRFDILLDGKITSQEENRPYSRTIMGIDSTGKKLYLMVVDGKRPNYSLGLSYQECAAVLKSIGAYNVMACDQGGSSCMYLKEVNGLISRPGDSQGIERPIYTHFGIEIK